MGFSLHQSFDCIDFVCRGDGEELIVNLMRQLGNHKQVFSKINGLIWRLNGKSVSNGKRTGDNMDLD